MLKCSCGCLQAIAASPEGAVNGYALGSFLYLGIVYCFPLALGVGGLALDLPVRSGQTSCCQKPVSCSSVRMYEARAADED